VLRSPFTSLVDLGRVHYPFLPVGVLLRDRFPVVEHVRAYDGPVLVIAGADHNDPALLDGEEFIEAVVGFLVEHT
jgi:hypothetical protein